MRSRLGKMFAVIVCDMKGNVPNIIDSFNLNETIEIAYNAFNDVESYINENSSTNSKIEILVKNQYLVAIFEFMY